MLFLCLLISIPAQDALVEVSCFFFPNSFRKKRVRKFPFFALGCKQSGFVKCGSDVFSCKESAAVKAG